MDERLEEIKKESKRLSGFGGKMDQEDINYLIQQAEKVPKLENENERLQLEIEGYASKLFDLANANYRIADDTKKMINQMVKGGSE